MLTATLSHRLATLLLGSLSLAACSHKNDDPAPADPTPMFKLGRYFDFATTAPGGGTSHTGSGAAYLSQDVTATSHLDAPSKVLALDFTAAPEEVYVEISQDQLAPGWVGNYPLRCKQRPTDPAFISYLYTNSTTGSTAILRLSDWNSELTGGVTITAYDTKRHLLSGHYEITAPNQRNPQEPNSGYFNCTIALTGEFTNLKVQQ